MTRPNYQLWVHEINENGGLLLGGKLYPVELVEYDDRSNSEEAVRAIERLVTQDYGFSQNTSTSITDRQPDLAGRWPLSFLLMGTATSYVQSLVDVLVEAREAGQIGDDVAMISVSDAFGIDQAQAARTLLAEHGFNITHDRTYPVGMQDFFSILAEVRDAKVFVAFSYPPDSVAITDQAQIHGFNPRCLLCRR